MAISLKKRIVAIILIPVLVLNITLFNVKETKAALLETVLTIVCAVVLEAETNQDYQNWYENTWRPNWQNTMSELFKSIGNPFNTSKLVEYFGPDPIQEIIRYIGQRDNINVNDITSDEAEEELHQWFSDCNIDNSNDSFTMSNDLRQFILYESQQLQDDNKMYNGYSVDLMYYSNNSDVLSIVQQYQDSYYVFLACGGNPISSYTLYFIPQGKYSFVLSNLTSSEKINFSFYDPLTYERSVSGCKVITISNGTVSQITDSSAYNTFFATKSLYSARRSYSYRADEFPIYYQSYQKDLNMVSYGKRFVIDIFGSYSIFQNSTRGEFPYYIDNSIYSSFVNSSGDYTLDSSNTNYTSYGDITSYIDSFNQTNGRYPSSDDIERFINNNNNTIINGGGSGGGNGGGSSGSGSVSVVNNNNPVFNNNIRIGFDIPSMSGNSVSGNGSGESGGVGNIFGFLSQIGNVIGDLIKNIGHVLAEIVEGITSVISDLLESIPTVFGDFMGALIGWLPEELRALITLSISAMIIVGLIKLFRG